MARYRRILVTYGRVSAYASGRGEGERRLAWVHPDQAKGRKAIGVPLNDTAMALVRAQVGKHPERVFTYDGKPVFQVSSMAWYKALKRAGIENFRWHDLRHTWRHGTCCRKWLDGKRKKWCVGTRTWRWGISRLTRMRCG
jgi:integrase